MRWNGEKINDWINLKPDFNKPSHHDKQNIQVISRSHIWLSTRSASLLIHLNNSLGFIVYIRYDASVSLASFIHQPPKPYTLTTPHYMGIGYWLLYQYHLLKTFWKYP